MIFYSRRRDSSDPYLDWKIRLFFAGAILAMVGIGLESSVLVGLAIPVLLLGIGLRILPGGKSDAEGGDPEEGETPPEEV